MTLEHCASSIVPSAQLTAIKLSRVHGISMAMTDCSDRMTLQHSSMRMGIGAKKIHCLVKKEQAMIEWKT